MSTFIAPKIVIFTLDEFGRTNYDEGEGELYAAMRRTLHSLFPFEVFRDNMHPYARCIYAHSLFCSACVKYYVRIGGINKSKQS